MHRTLVLVGLFGCAHHAKGFDQIAVDVPPGLSGLAVDDQQHLWAIAERDPIAVEIVLAKSPQIIRHPLVGVPDDVDTESIAALGDGRFAIGVEGHSAPSAGVLFAQRQPDGGLAVTSAISLSDAELGVELRVNNGAESLCGHGERFVVGIETAGVTPDGTRFAPIVRFEGVAPQPPQRLHLTTPNGKLSSLSCKIGPDGSLEMLAIERDFGVVRVLRATAASGQVEIVPEVVFDLWPMARDQFGGRLNLEGIATLRDGRIVMVNDNQGKGLGGPTWLFVSRSAVRR